MTPVEGEQIASTKRMPRGQMEKRIMKALTTSGEAGMTVKELAATLSIRPTSVYAWFFAKGKQIPTVKKIGPAKYRLETEAQKNDSRIDLPKLDS
jgi:hypothetical protein